MTFDVEAQDCFSGCFRLLWGWGNFDSTRFPATSHFDLGFHYGEATDFFCGRLGRFGGVSDDACQNRYAVALEHVTGLIFVKIHARGSFRVVG